MLLRTVYTIQYIGVKLKNKSAALLRKERHFCHLKGFFEWYYFVCLALFCTSNCASNALGSLDLLKKIIAAII